MFTRRHRPTFWPRLAASMQLLLLALGLSWMTGCASTQPAPDLLQWKVDSSHPLVEAGGDTNAVVTVDVSAFVPPEDQHRIPLNLSLVIDHSGSMTDKQMQDTRHAVSYMLSQLQPDDTVSVVAFSTRAEVLVEQDEWDDVDKGELKLALDTLKPEGTTAMYQGLQVAQQQMNRTFDPARINRIILFSDGIPNDAGQLHGFAQQMKNRGIAVTTMGLGAHYNEDLMAEIADLSGGNYHFIKESADIETFFLEEKDSMEQIVARSARLVFHLGPGVTLKRTLGAQASANGRSLTVHLGELAAGEARQIALEVAVRGGGSGAKVELTDVELMWDDVVHWSGQHTIHHFLAAEATKDTALIEQKRKKVVVERAGRLAAAWEMEQAILDYQEGDVQSARQRMEQAASEYRVMKKEAQASITSGAAPAPPKDRRAVDVPSVAVEAESISLDGYMDDVIDAISGSEPESDEGKVLIKSVKAKKRALTRKKRRRRD